MGQPLRRPRHGTHRAAEDRRVAGELSLRHDGAGWARALSDRGAVGGQPGALRRPRLRPRRGRAAARLRGRQVERGRHHGGLRADAGQRAGRLLGLQLYRNEKTGPFIHALGAADGFAVCLDLPTAGKENAEAALAWTLAAGPHDTILYAVNAALGLVAEVDATGPRIVRTATIPAAPASSRGGPLARLGDWLAPAASAKEAQPGVAAVSPDGRTLYVARPDGLLAIDTATLQPRGRQGGGQVSVIRPATSLLASPDGAQLFAVVGDGGGYALYRLDPASGMVLGEFSRALNVTAVVHVAAAH